jgi:hypothetical protein
MKLLHFLIAAFMGVVFGGLTLLMIAHSMELSGAEIFLAPGATIAIAVSGNVHAF